MLHFADPEYFRLVWALVLLLLAAPLLMFRHRHRMRRFGNLDLIKFPSLNYKLRWLKILLLIISMLLLIISLARPQIGAKELKFKRAGLNIIFALDTSKSMLTEDIKPNRLDRAKAEILALLDSLKNDNIGLILFSGGAYLQVPLTSDYSAFELFLNDVDTNITSDQGTSIDQAINVAANVYSKGNYKTKILILISDGEEHNSQALKAASLAAKSGIKIFVVGIGTTKGQLIPIRGSNGKLSGYKKDAKGRLVISKLNAQVLNTIAQSTGGQYYELSDESTGLKKLHNDLNRLNQEQLKEQTMQQYGERFQILLLFALGLLVLESFISERYRES